MAGTELQKEQYTVAWICALPIELAASVEMLDEEHPSLPQNPSDNNSYTYGRIGEHKVVIGCLPKGQLGVVSAASVALQMKSSFSAIRFGLMVGIGGGVPDEEVDIRLGDVIVSQPRGQHGGVVQYDLGKTRPGGTFERTGSLNSPPSILLTALTTAEAIAERNKSNINAYLCKLANQLPDYSRPRSLRDDLYKPTYIHASGRTCLKCSKEELVDREKRDKAGPVIHYGTIASGNQVMKDAVTRDKLNKDLGGVLCFDMEAAGLMNNFPCLVIRGVSDYADSHKNNGWQRYAAATAAAFAKELLMHVAASSVAETRTIKEAMGTLGERVAQNTQVAHRVEGRMRAVEEEEILNWLSLFPFDKPQHESHRTRMNNTGLGLIHHPMYVAWRDDSIGLLWLHGVAGCGKTVLCSTAITNIQQLCQPGSRKRLAYWYFQFSSVGTQDVCIMLRSLIRQLSSIPLQPKVHTLRDEHKRAGSNPDFEELVEILSATLQGLEEEVFILIDALDECPDQEEKQNRRCDRSRLFSLIQHLLDGRHDNLHLLATSRWESDISHALRKTPNSTVLNIENLVEDDIALFVRKALTEKPLSDWKSGVQSKVTERLLAKERRFRWADLQIKRLQQCPDQESLLSVLESLPETLEATYQEALGKVPRYRRKHVRKILMWLATSFRPLTIIEVAAAAHFVDPSYVWKFCSSLLVTIIDNEGCKTADQIIKLAHFSVQEFLLTQHFEEEAVVWYRFSSRSAHCFVATESISYLLTHHKSDKGKDCILSKGLLEYVARFWPHHATMHYDTSEESQIQSDTESVLLGEIDKLFSPDHSDSYRHWLRTYNPDGDFGSFEWNHKLWLIFPSPLYYASLLGLGQTIKRLFGRSCRIVAEGNYGNAINAAAIKGRCGILLWLTEQFAEATSMVNLFEIVRQLEKNSQRVLRILLDWVGGDSITQHVLEAAAQNRHSGHEMMTLLLQQCTDVTITEDVIKAAAENPKVGKQITTLLLDRLGSDFALTNDIIRAAAQNSDSSIDVMALLLDRWGKKVTITEDIVETAAKNRKNAKELITLLHDQQGADIIVTEKVVKAAAGNWESCDEVMVLLLECRKDLTITKKMVEVIAAGFNEKVMETLLLIQGGAGISITDKVIQAAAGNFWHGKGMMALLLSHQNAGFTITEKTVKAAAGNHESGKDVMRLLLNQQKADFNITERIFRIIAAGFDWEIIQMLTDRKRLEVTITEKVVEAIAENQGNGQEIMKRLLDQQNIDVTITEKIMEAAARNTKSGENVVKLLLDLQGADFTITEKMVEIAAAGFGKEIMQRILDRRATDVTVSKAVIEAAAGNWESGKAVMVLLLKQQETKFPITEEIVSLVAANFDKEVMQLLHDRLGSGLTITERVVMNIAARSNMKATQSPFGQRGAGATIADEVVKWGAGDWEDGKAVMALLLNQKELEVTISERVVEIIAGEFDEEIMQSLLDRQGASINITENVLEAAVRNRENGTATMALLVKQRRADASITERVVKTIAATSEAIMRLVLDQQELDLAITEMVIVAAAGNEESGKDILALLLKRRGAEITITEKVVESAVKNQKQGKEIMALLLDQEEANFSITENMVQIIAASSDEEIMQLLLQRHGANFTITEKVVEAAVENWESSNDLIVLLLSQQKADFTMTEKMVEIIAATSDDMMEILLERRGEEVAITESVIIAAARNERSGKEVIELLLDRRKSDLIITEKVITAAAGNWESGKEIIALLLNQQPGVVQRS